MKIATWNIYWLGDRTGSLIKRTNTDYEHIVRVIRKLAPDVLALQEIVDPLIMEKIVKSASGEGKNYVIRSHSGHWLTSDPKPTDISKNLQKVFLCFNSETIEFLHGAEINGGAGRKPYAALFRHKASGTEFVAVVVHLRAGFPNFLDKDDASFRSQEVNALIQWLTGQSAAANPSFPKPDSDNIIVLGDFNAEIDDPNQSLDFLKKGQFSKWLWNNPQPDANRRETAIDDRYIIDFIMLSPALKNKITSPPSVYAWDYDPQFGGLTTFHNGINGEGNLKSYGVSDHRPVIAVLNF